MLGKFRNLSLAKSFSEKTLQISAIILGDDDGFWVVTLAQMDRLLKAGYELAQ